MLERFRDKSRDKLAEDLKSLGKKADLAERGRIEEKIAKPFLMGSLGIIDVQEGPIGWINIVRKRRDKNGPEIKYVLLAIPDGKAIKNKKAVDIKTVRKKTFPLFGKIVDTCWKGKDNDLGLITILSDDVDVKNLAKRIGNLLVRNHYEEAFRGWILRVDRTFSPTSQDWQTIQKIANCLLSSSRNV